ncbi:MAG: hypothetical protein AAGG09_14845 [Pseudomonadota bacterium]
MSKWVLAAICPLVGIVGIAASTQYAPLGPVFWFLLGVLAASSLSAFWPRLFPALLGRRHRLASDVIKRSCPASTEHRAAGRLAGELDLDFAVALDGDMTRQAAERAKLVRLWALLWRARAVRRRAFLGAPLPVVAGAKFTAIEELFGDVAEAALPGSGTSYARLVNEAHQAFQRSGQRSAASP